MRLSSQMTHGDWIWVNNCMLNYSDSPQTHHSITQKCRSKFTHVSLLSIFRVPLHRDVCVCVAIDEIGHCLDSCSQKQFENHDENFSRDCGATCRQRDEHCKLWAEITVSMTLYKIVYGFIFSHVAHWWVFDAPLDPITVHNNRHTAPVIMLKCTFLSVNECNAK